MSDDILTDDDRVGLRHLLAEHEARWSARVSQLAARGLVPGRDVFISEPLSLIALRKIAAIHGVS